MNFNFSIAAISINVFFGIYLIFSEYRKSQAVKLLTLVLFFLSFELFVNSILYAGEMYNFPHFFKMEGIFKLALYPTLYLFILTITKVKKEPYSKWIYLIYLPFLINSSWLLGKYLFINSEMKLEMIEMFYANTRPGPSFLFSNTFLAIKEVFIPLIFVFLSAFKLIKIKQGFVTAASFSILILLVCLFSFHLLADFINQTVFLITNDMFVEWTTRSILVSLMSLLIVIYLIKSIEYNANDPFQILIETYKKTKLANDQIEKIMGQVLQHFEEEKPYLNPQITLLQIAEDLKINSSYLSQSINTLRNENFSTFLNSYRISEAKERLKDHKFQAYTIEAIAKDVGFKSKSAFYRAFNNSEGISPLEYQKR